MEESQKNKLIAGAIGAATICGLMFLGGVVAPAIFSSSMASEPEAAQMLGIAAPGKALDINLMKFNGDYFEVGTAPGVSLQPTSQVQIKKIGYGQTTFVNILSTPSGTYSTEGLVSPNIRYPGIYTQKLHVFASPFSGEVLGWSKLGGWVKIPLLDAGSIAYLADDQVPHSANGVCVKSAQSGLCI